MPSILTQISVQILEFRITQLFVSEVELMFHKSPTVPLKKIKNNDNLNLAHSGVRTQFVGPFSSGLHKQSVLMCLHVWQLQSYFCLLFY